MGADVKKRGGAHEDTIREFRIDGRGITIGAPLDRSRRPTDAS